MEGESPTGHSGPNEDEDNVAMAEVELNRHRDQLESRDMNPPSTSSDVQIEINRPDGKEPLHPLFLDCRQLFLKLA